MCLSFRKHTHISMTTYTHKCVFKMNRMKSAGLNKDENRRQKVYLSGGKIFFNLIYYSYLSTVNCISFFTQQKVHASFA